MSTKSRRILRFGVAILLSLLLMGCEDNKQENNGGSATQPADLLPQNNEISGWSKGTGSGDYQEAYDQSSLYDIIDGGAEVYISHGFESGVQQIYRGTIASQETPLYLFITDQGDSANCASLLQEPTIRPPGGTAVDSLGDEAIIDRTLPFDLVLYFRNNRFFVRTTLSKSADAQASENIALSFAHNVNSKIP